MARAGLAGRRVGLAACVAVAALAYSASHFSLDTDVSRLLPERASGDDSLMAELAQRLTDSELSRTMILTLRGAAIEQALAAGRALEERLAGHPEVAWVRGGVDPNAQADFFALYFPRRHLFLSAQPADELPRRLSDEGLREAAGRLRAELGRPTATLVKRIAREDPLLAFPALLERVRGGERSLAVRDGRFVSNDGEHAVLLLATRASAFDATRQRALLQAIDAALADLRAEIDPALRLEASGMNRFGVRIEREIKGDIRFIMIFASLGVALLFFVFLRSPSGLVVAMVPHAGGVLAAATVGLLAFGSLNALAVAFGISLVGVSIDYAIHVLNHHRLRGRAAGASDGRATARRLRPSLLLGGATTIASFAGLAFAGFPGFWQMGLLAAVGVGTALFLSLWLVPVLLRVDAPPPLALATARVLGRAVRRACDARTAMAALGIACLAAGVWAAPRVHWADDISRLTTLDAALLAEEERVRARVARFDASRFIVTVGDDAEQALQRNDDAARRLLPLVGDALANLRSLHGLLWSERLQRENARALAAEERLAERVEQIFAEEGFRAGSFAPFAEALESPPEPLDLPALRASPVGDLARALVLELGGGRTALVTHLEGVRDENALRGAIEGLPGTWLVNQQKVFEEIYAAYRIRTLEVVASGALSVLALLGLRYRRLRPTLAAFLPSLLVAALLVFLAAISGIEANLLHVIGLVLVMGMGVDYGIFVVDSRGNADELDATVLSLALSCLTTIFIFGLLALARHPVLSAIGLTTGAGVLLSFLLAPVALLVAGPPEDART